MDAKTTGIVAYITWIGLVIAFVLGDREGAVMGFIAAVNGEEKAVPLLGQIRLLK